MTKRSGDKISLARDSLSRQVYERLKQMIIMQEVPGFQMGEKLNESAIAKMFNCSVTPVRESINMLRADGLIIGDSYRSSSIVSMSESDIRDLFQVRKILEVGGLRQAFPDIQEADIKNLWSFIEKARKRCDDWDPVGVSQVDREFHMLMMQKSGNELLCRMLTSISEQVEMARAPIYKERRDLGKVDEFMLPVYEHEKIVTAMAQGDLEGAVEALEEHLDRICRDACSYYRDRMGR